MNNINRINGIDHKNLNTNTIDSTDNREVDADTPAHLYPAGEMFVVYKAQQIMRRSRLGTRVSVLLSFFGEHSAGWALLGFITAIGAKNRRKSWIDFSILTLSAHALSIIVKYIVRRPRPNNIFIDTASTAGRFSFPSSHMCSTTYAVLTLRHLMKIPSLFSIMTVIAMAAARLERGVHYPSDLLGGIMLGSILYRVFPILSRGKNKGF